MQKYQSRKDKINVQEVNTYALDNVCELIARAENKFGEQIKSVCDSIVTEHKNIILLCGPSSAGKTTTSIMMAEEIASSGMKCVRVSLDNFYKNRNDVPFWKNGNRNFETIESLDMEYFKDRVGELMSKGHANFPVFDFTIGTRSDRTFEVEFDDNTYIIFEGIHALSPHFDECISTEKSMRIYMSVHTNFVETNGDKVLTARDLRLVRRIIRDNWGRATSPLETLAFWDDVCRGEDKYIHPYRVLADAHIVSAHSYEPAVYRDEFLEIMSDCVSDKYQDIVDHLRYAMGQFVSIDRSMIPKTSLLKEFIKLH